MENNRHPENFDFSFDEVMKDAKNINENSDSKNDVINNPDSFDKNKVFKREPLKTSNTEKEDAKKLEEARNKINEMLKNNQGNS